MKRSGAFVLWLLVAAWVEACSADASSGADASVGAEAATPDGNGGDAATVGGTGVGLYGNCLGAPRRTDDNACEGPALCLPYFSRSGEAQVCTLPCDLARSGADCPRAPEGTATPVCRDVDAPRPPMCLLSCQLDLAGCPRGMVCNGFYCLWPR